MVVAGPTLDDYFGAYFGTLPRNPDGPICAFYALSDTPVQVTVRSLAVDGPFVAVTDAGDCRPPGGTPGPVCAPGAALTADSETEPEAIGCWFGITLPPDPAVRAQNHAGSHHARMTLAAVCTGDGASGPVCGAPEVLAQRPSPSTPVSVDVEVVTPLRYCGATEYAQDDTGTPVPPGEPLSNSDPAYGCT